MNAEVPAQTIIPLSLYPSAMAKRPPPMSTPTWASRTRYKARDSSLCLIAKDGTAIGHNSLCLLGTILQCSSTQGKRKTLSGGGTGCTMFSGATTAFLAALAWALSSRRSSLRLERLSRS